MDLPSLWNNLIQVSFHFTSFPCAIRDTPIALGPFPEVPDHPRSSHDALSFAELPNQRYIRYQWHAQTLLKKMIPHTID